jgi:hypothetical protein
MAGNVVRAMARLEGVNEAKNQFMFNRTLDSFPNAKRKVGENTAPETIQRRSKTRGFKDSPARLHYGEPMKDE